MHLATLIVFFFPNWMCSAMPARHRKTSSKAQHTLNDDSDEDPSNVDDVDDRSEKDISLMLNRIFSSAGVGGREDGKKDDVYNANNVIYLYTFYTLTSDAIDIVNTTFTLGQGGGRVNGDS